MRSGPRVLAAVCALLAGCDGTLADGPRPVPPPAACDVNEMRGLGLPGISPTVQQLCYSLFTGTPSEVRCVASNVRPGSIFTPATAHTACVDAHGTVTYLNPSTPGFGAVLTGLAGPAGDLLRNVVVPVAP